MSSGLPGPRTRRQPPVTHRLLSLVHVLLNRGHPRAADCLARVICTFGGGLSAARAQALRRRISLEAGTTVSAERKAWASDVSNLLVALDGELSGISGPYGDQSPAATVSPGLLCGTVEALTLAFHPVVHQGGDPSPIIVEPDRFAKMLDPHPVVQRLRTELPDPEEPRRAALGAHATPPRRRHRILVVTDTNLTFMGDLLEHWHGRGDVDLRVRDLRAEGSDPQSWSLSGTVTDRLRGHHPDPPEDLSGDLKWADLVWVEWGGALAARLSACRGLPRVIVRLHKYEAFTSYPQLTLWEGVDDLVLVSRPIELALERTVPGIQARTRVHVESNVVDLRRYCLPKRPTAARTLALVGWDRPVKDPDWALDVLEVLRRQDDGWRLLLVGRPPACGTDMATRAWADHLHRRLQTFGSAVECLGQREDVPEVLRDVSVILSSSLVESAHLALQQGVASGCLPVVRNWPGMVGLGGPRDMYPPVWVVETPTEAAARILAVTGTIGPSLLGPAASADACEASSWTLQHLDQEVVLPRIDALVLGEQQ